MVFAAVRNVLALLFMAAVAQAANEVTVTSYSYNGATLTGALSVYNVAYSKVLTIIYANLAQTWGNTCAASYTSGPDSSSREVWSFNCAIGSAGISQFYVKYDVNGVSYYANNGGYGVNYQVTQVTVAPSTPGWQSDITTYLTAALPSFKTFMLNNTSPSYVSGALPGVVTAAAPGGVNNYIFHWIRDASLVANVVNDMYIAGDTSLATFMWNHATLTKTLQGLTTLTGLGEAKYYVTGTAFSDGWCRPQDDGPALRASTFMRFSKAYLAKGGSLANVIAIYNSTATGIIKNDLAYVMSHYNNANGCDLWEEQRGIHFFTVAVQRRALYEAQAFATMLGDTASAATYAASAATVNTLLATFWSSSSSSIVTTISGRVLDAAIPLGAVHGNNGDGVFAPESDKVLASIYKLEAAFVSEYAINAASLSDASGLPMSYAVGRYTGDTYDGSGNTGGNPWYLTTVILAETAYRAATAFVKAGSITVTSVNMIYFNGGQPSGLGLSVTAGTYANTTTTFTSIIEAMKAYGDKHIRRIKYHGASGYHLNEQYNRATGLAQGVNDLTWSYAAMTTAAAARAELKALSA